MSLPELEPLSMGELKRFELRHGLPAALSVMRKHLTASQLVRPAADRNSASCLRSVSYALRLFLASPRSTAAQVMNCLIGMYMASRGPP